MLQPRADGTAAGCEACHTTKSWKELSGFDHSKTSFPLLGTHRAMACIDCHKPPNLETKLINVDFKTAPTKCEECHEDAHGKQFAKAGVTQCAECHNSLKWKPAFFDHDQRTEFPLRGVHRNVRCAECHKLTRWSPASPFSSTSRRRRNVLPATGLQPRFPARSPANKTSLVCGCVPRSCKTSASIQAAIPGYISKSHSRHFSRACLIFGPC